MRNVIKLSGPAILVMLMMAGAASAQMVIQPVTTGDWSEPRRQRRLI